MKRIFCLSASVLVVLLLAPLNALAQTIVDQVRLGNYTEDMTLYNKGKRIAFMDGYGIYGVRATGNGTKLRQLGDLRDVPGFEGTPNGLTYVETEKRFVFNQRYDPANLYFVDRKGRFVETRPIDYPDGTMPDHVEGIAYLPVTAAQFPDHLVMATMTWEPWTATIQVMTRQGDIVHQIFPQDYELGGYVLGLEFLPPDRLLATTIDNRIFTLDFQGNVMAVSEPVSSLGAIEGLARTATGEVMAASTFAGIVVTLDENLDEMPGAELDATIGVNVNWPQGLAWDSGLDRYLLNDGWELELMEVAASLDASSVIHALDDEGLPRCLRMSYLENEALLAIAHFDDPETIVLCDQDGLLVDQLPFSEAEGPYAVAFDQQNEWFAVRFVDDPTRLHVLNRVGGAVGEIDLSPIGVEEILAVTYFGAGPTAEARLLVAADNDRALVLDRDGELLFEFDYREELGVLNPGDLTEITTGPRAGTLAMVDRLSAEIVLFTLD